MAQTRRFYFETKEQLDRFIELYKDMFIPWSGCSIETKRRSIRRSKMLVNDHLEEGYVAYDSKFSSMSIEANMEPEAFKEIINNGMFRKERICPGVNGWVFEG